MSKIKNTLIISSSLFISWIFIEIVIDKITKKQIKKQILKIGYECSSSRFQNLYRKSFRIVNSELNSIKNDEKEHTIMSLKKTFINRSSDNLESLANQINYYKRLRHQSIEDFSKYVKVDYMLWYPYTCRFIFSFLNNCQLAYWKWNHNFDISYFKKHCIYTIKPKDNNFNKTIIIFIGLGGILQPFGNLINYLINKKYKIIIPIYGPCQASLNYNFNCHEIEFQLDFYDYLISKHIKNIDILSWSLGGVLYKGFENNILNLKSIGIEDVKVNKAYLFEPLLGMRGCMDTYFSKIRNYSDTLYIFNTITDKKYYFYNKVFSYFLHTQVGYSTSNSFGCFTSVEFKKNNNLIKYPRYLFISSDDVIINGKIDKEFIDSNFDSDKIFYRKGYHGGWIGSSKLSPILDQIMK